MTEDPAAEVIRKITQRRLRGKPGKRKDRAQARLEQRLSEVQQNLAIANAEITVLRGKIKTCYKWAREILDVTGEHSLP